MTHTEEEIALFDRYLSDKMDSAEKSAFEERLNQAVSFKNSFDAYVDFSKQIEAGAEYKHIKKELAQIHADLFPSKKKKLFTPKFLIPFGIAASVAIIVLINPFGSVSDMSENKTSYQELANNDSEVYEEESMQFDSNGNGAPMVGDQATLNNELTPISRSPIGSAFLISEGGYFLTSKHLTKGTQVIRLQQKQLGITFEGAIVYEDSLLDFAIIKCSPEITANFNVIPYRLSKTSPELGDEVFTLGYPKKDIVYTQGVVSSETGFESDSIYFEVSLPSNAGHSGAPLFDQSGEVIGIITAQHSNQQAVTYILKPEQIKNCLETLTDSIPIDMTHNKRQYQQSKGRYIKAFRPFIFEVH